jgi:hypothetical protein
VPATAQTPTVVPVSVTIGGLPAPNVSYAGLTPGFAGLYQVNFAGLYQVNVVVPDGVPAGDQAVMVAIAGQSSPPVTMRIR